LPLESLRWRGPRRHYSQGMSPKERATWLRGARNSASFMVFRLQRREIVALAHGLGIPPEKLKEHFLRLRQEGVRPREMAQSMMSQLQEINELAEQANVGRPELMKAFENHSVEDIIKRLQQMAQQQAPQ